MSDLRGEVNVFGNAQIITLPIRLSLLGDSRMSLAHGYGTAIRKELLEGL